MRRHIPPPRIFQVFSIQSSNSYLSLPPPPPPLPHPPPPPFHASILPFPSHLPTPHLHLTLSIHLSPPFLPPTLSLHPHFPSLPPLRPSPFLLSTDFRTTLIFLFTFFCFGKRSGRSAGRNSHAVWILQDPSGPPASGLGWLIRTMVFSLGGSRWRPPLLAVLVATRYAANVTRALAGAALRCPLLDDDGLGVQTCNRGKTAV